MTIKEASKHALNILKQVMEEKLNATNIEVNLKQVDFNPVNNFNNFFFLN